MYKLSCIVLALCTLATVLVPSLVSGQIRSSTNYQIERDTINIGGGLGTSASYQVEDSIGDTATGRSASASYILEAGYQQAGDTFISISAPSDVTMASINGLLGGASTSTVSWTVTTNSSAGYSMTAVAGADPALSGTYDAFLDYVPAGAAPDFTWSIDTTEALFGFSVLGTDTAQRFKDDGAACNVSTGNVTERCWDGFSTTPTTIATRASANAPSGTATTLELRAEVGTNRLLTADTYSASITVTAVAL